ncbi:glycosyltransferase family 32 protein [Butyrivibrio sp. AE3006]|uniref:glycosyltransferase family 32 protein n=1 Tax=Butyrivibrio sp. AE3006 TaxID=1280673 RepID=UPI0003FEF317|nr:glycosyltransferase [Butyrivibrio sp. AE3006]
MKFINCSYESFIQSIGQRNIIQFGVSSAWPYFCGIFPDVKKEIVDNTLFIVDNSLEKQNHSFQIMGREIDVNSPDVLSSETGYLILITASLMHHEAICEQLQIMDLGEDVECYSLYLMTISKSSVDNTAVNKYFEDRKDKCIPARIHSFWFGKAEKPDLYKKCIDSWYRYCPDYEIIEWNTENYDISKNRYMLEAFEHQKWAFVSDYARLDCVYNQGGVYLDMDVELVASLDPYLFADIFFCKQDDGMMELGSGFGAAKGNALIREMLESYDDRTFVLPDGSIDNTPQPELMHPIFLKNGFNRNHDSQIVGDCLVLSNDYITCYAGDGSVDNARLGIHWHNASWLDDKDRHNLKASAEAKEPLIKKYFTVTYD